MGLGQSVKQTRQHFRELSDVAFSHGVGKALRYEWQKTMERGYVPAVTKALLLASGIAILSYVGICGVESIIDKKPIMESLVPLSSSHLLPAKAVSGAVFLNQYLGNLTKHKARKAEIERDFRAYGLEKYL
jgi:hypothetical protein